MFYNTLYTHFWARPQAYGLLVTVNNNNNNNNIHVPLNEERSLLIELLVFQILT